MADWDDDEWDETQVKPVAKRRDDSDSEEEDGGKKSDNKDEGSGAEDWDDDDWDPSQVKPVKKKSDEESDEEEDEKKDSRKAEDPSGHNEEETSDVEDWEREDWDASKIKRLPKEGEDSDEEVDTRKPASRSQTKADSSAKAKAKAAAASAQPSLDTLYSRDLKELEMSLQSHVDTLVKLVVPKLQASTAKRAPATFWGDALRSLQLKLSVADCEQLHKLVKDLQSKQLAAAAEARVKKLAEEEAQRKAKELAANEVPDEEFYKDLM